MGPHSPPLDVAVLRSRLGLTQGELAQLCGATRKSVGTWEAGANTPRGLQRAFLTALWRFITRAPERAAPLGRSIREELTLNGQLVAIRTMLNSVVPARP